MNTETNELAKGLRKMSDSEFQDAYKACKGAAPALDVALDIELTRRAFSA